MKIGDIRKVLIDYCNSQQEIIVVLLDETDSEYRFYSIEGMEFMKRKTSILSEHSVRSIPKETRTLLQDYAKLYQKLKVVKNKYMEAKQPLEEAMKKINTKALRNSRGLLTKEEFAMVFKNNLPAYLQKEMDEFRIEIYGYEADSEFLCIEYIKDIEKYFRKGSFVYEEYDGNIFMRNDAEKDPEYQAYLKQYTKKLSVKQKPTSSYLGIGDKDWLYCCTKYNLNLKKPLTTEYAKELAKKFSK